MHQTVRTTGAAAVAAAALTLTGCGLSVQAADNLTEEYSTDSYARAEVLELNNRDGATTIVGGDVTGIEVERVLRYSGDTPPGEDVAERDGTLVVTAKDCGARISVGMSWCSIDYTVTVPTQTAVSVDSTDGPVTIDGTGGDATVTSSDGAVTVLGAVQRLEATTRDGGLVLDGTEAAAVTAETSDGGVEITGATVDEISLTTRDGRVRVDGTTFGELAVNSGDGAVDITAVTAFTSIDVAARDGGVTVLTPRGGGPYAVATSARDGAVDVAVPRDDDAESAIAVTVSDGSVTVAES